MKTIQLMLLLSVVSAGIVHASDQLLDNLAYAAVPAAAPSIWQQLSSSLPSMEGLRNSRPVNLLSSSWSNIARPALETAGSVLRYPVPTALSSRFAQLPGAQTFASWPREAQNAALGSVALPAALAAAYKFAPYARQGGQKLYQGGQKLYQQWRNNNDLEKLYREIGILTVKKYNLQSQGQLLYDRIKEVLEMVEGSNEEGLEENELHLKLKENVTDEQKEILNAYMKIDNEISETNNKVQQLVSQVPNLLQPQEQQQGLSTGLFSNWSRPSIPSWLTLPSLESVRSYLPFFQNQNNSNNQQ